MGAIANLIPIAALAAYANLQATSLFTYFVASTVCDGLSNSVSSISQARGRQDNALWALRRSCLFAPGLCSKPKPRAGATFYEPHGCLTSFSIHASVGVRTPTVAAQAYIADRMSPSNRAGAFSLLMGVMSLALLLGPAAGSAMPSADWCVFPRVLRCGGTDSAAASSLKHRCTVCLGRCGPRLPGPLSPSLTSSSSSRSLSLRCAAVSSFPLC